MQVTVLPYRSTLPVGGRSMRLACGMVCSGLFALTTTYTAHASASAPPPSDAQTISALEVRAHDAPVREQVQLYADIADRISLLASRQIAEGDVEHAQETLQHLEACSAAIESNLLRDSKGLKKTELLLHSTNRRLADLVRSASGDMKPLVQSALRRLDKAQTALLGAIFEK